MIFSFIVLQVGFQGKRTMLILMNIPEITSDPSFVAAQHRYTLPELQQYFSILNSIRSEDEIL